MQTVKNMVLTLLVVAFLACSVLGCNTMRGAGRDLEEGGQALQKAAERVQQK